MRRAGGTGGPSRHEGRNEMAELLASVVETGNVGTTFGVLLFAAAGTGMVLAILLLGAVVRPKVYHPEKGAPSTNVPSRPSARRECSLTRASI